MTPQLVVMVIVVANFLSTVRGCFSVPGVRNLEVGLAQPATVCGRSSAWDVGIKAKELNAMARAQSAANLFLVKFLLPLDRSRRFASHIQHNSVNFSHLVGNSSRNLF